jgi:hypothetical protein
MAPTTADALDGLNMPLAEAMMTQRAVRRVHPDPVDDAVVLKCIELALRAPTGANGQNWEFIVVRDRGVMDKLARCYREGWKYSYGWLLKGAGDRDESIAKVIRAAQWQVDHFTEVPVLVVACLRLTVREGRVPFSLMPGILGIDLSERAEPFTRRSCHGFGCVADHLAAVAARAGTENPWLASLGDAVLRGGARLAARALRTEHPHTGWAGDASRHLRQPRLARNLIGDNGVAQQSGQSTEFYEVD